ncbi:efflux RND transporter periplasmic adaptor subunit [Acidisphaera rubrifaciens]|uniref:efflux RND transporter periplasmic adaptor subunit n=1 Tax=Acidisphaera rubrifaciens TaxID=50715 RepID=UPI0018F21698|nr:efflux RND transporter periplasmic adaptor subunit [Acidisphaera rubrifaciens]
MLIGRRLAMATLCLLAAVAPQARAQRPPGGPPAVGIVRVARRAITETNEFVGRIQATNRVEIVARVTAFLEKQAFVEGAEVKKGELLYLLEQPPFQADVEAKRAAVAQAKAQLENANITLGRAQALLHTPAGQQSTVDNARATQLSDAAQVLSAQAQLEQSEINLGYTEIRSPIDGRIGRTSVTIGNVVTPSSRTLTTIVSQDPMWVVFPVSERTVIDLLHKYATKGGYNAVVIRLRLPDGKMYGQAGKLDFVDNTVSPTTDTVILRGTIPNPPLPLPRDQQTIRALTDGEFVTVLLEGVEPVEVLSIPRAAVLSDQQGDYVFTVNSANKVEQRRVQLGQSTPMLATVLSGLKDGEEVILDGLQRVHNGQVVSPGPAAEPAGQAAAGAVNQ